MNMRTDFSDLRPAEREGVSQYLTEFNPDTKTLWGFFNARGNPCFTPTLLHDIRAHDEQFEQGGGFVNADGVMHKVQYYVAGSRTKGIFNLGGDLALFQLLIRSRDRDALRNYGRACIDCIYPRTANYFTNNLITISLVQGDALGGGFETALASNIIVAEEGVTMGLPEILFNLFPGMGAYSLLARRVGLKKAEQMILSGKMFSATELYELGVVDVLAPKGGGIAATEEWIRHNRKRHNGMQAIFAARNEIQPITREELDSIVELWVDAALNLDERDLKMMKRLVTAQVNRRTKAQAEMLEDDLTVIAAA